MEIVDNLLEFFIKKNIYQHFDLSNGQYSIERPILSMKLFCGDFTTFKRGCSGEMV